MKFQERIGMAVIGFSMASLLFMLHDLSSTPESRMEPGSNVRAETPERFGLH